MSVFLSRAGARFIARLPARLDRTASSHLYDRLVGIMHRPCQGVMIDLSAVAQATGPGLRGLVVSAQLAQALHRQVLICGARPPLRRELQRMDMGQLLLPTDPQAAAPWLHGRPAAPFAALLPCAPGPMSGVTGANADCRPSCLRPA